MEKTFTNAKSNTFVKSNLTLQDDMISKTIREESSGGIQIQNIEILRKGNLKPTLSTAGFGFKDKDIDELSDSSEKKKEVHEKNEKPEKHEKHSRIQKKKPTINIVQEESAR